jgi:hypothetical protein
MRSAHLACSVVNRLSLPHFVCRCFDKQSIDKLNKDTHHKKVDKSFAVEIFLQCVADEEIIGEEITGTEVGQEDEMDDEDDEDDVEG